MAASEERVAEEYMTMSIMVTGLQRKKLEKERISCGGECLRLQERWKL